ncbi:MAG: polyribonucleotide nucleotidyltransferase [Bdellovibrionaceae bacterium]|nr:polyribonucleotide nucleotidyltransferase [Pseudobdellovibrionaceae bacterium]
MNPQNVTMELGGKTLSIETGKYAKQADGSVMVSYGDTRVLVTACSAKEAKPGQSFFPLTVEYSEKYYAAGKIPGSFMKREGRPSSEATLAARMIDRPIRPLFPEGYLNDTQIVATVMSLDTECDVESAASIGAAAALHISDIPFNGPTAAVRVGRIDGNYVINPTHEQLESGASDLEIFLAGTESAIMMVEGGAKEVPEEEVLGAILFGHEEIKKVCKKINDLREKAGVAKRTIEIPQLPAEIVSSVKEKAQSGLQQALQIREKQQRYQSIDELKTTVLESLVSESEKEADPTSASEKQAQVKEAFDDLKYHTMRQMILTQGTRIDGRDKTTVRPIWTEVGILPKAHGSSVFTRGETQVVAAVALGTGEDEQIVDNLIAKTMNPFMLHYNFPPFSVGECGRMGGTSRREIGHGKLAEKAIYNAFPSHDEFPYTVRIVCETLESNGSSSMASVCSTSMALMDAGVPFKKPVAGIAMGLIKEQDNVAILTDILGDEDHLGDMDFKVAGTADGITAIQMDIKIEGVTEEIMRTALTQAKEGRSHILGEMTKSISETRTELNEQAPRITTLSIPVDKIGMVVGPGGKMIKSIIAETGAKADIDDDGTVRVASNDSAASKRAIEMIEGIVAEVELNKVYKGIVKKVVDFGAFVGVLPNQDGLLHISEIAHERVRSVEDYIKEGDEIEVKVIDIENGGRIKLSRKALLDPPEGGIPPRGGSGKRPQPRQ